MTTITIDYTHGGTKTFSANKVVLANPKMIVYGAYDGTRDITIPVDVIKGYVVE